MRLPLSIYPIGTEQKAKQQVLYISLDEYAAVTLYPYPHSFATFQARFSVKLTL